MVDPQAPSLAPSSPQSCPEGARDFRAEQCAEFDSREFQGRRYKWLPYYGGECASLGAPAAPPCVVPRWAPSLGNLFATLTLHFAVLTTILWCSIVQSCPIL